jgi:hypothetical protein
MRRIILLVGVALLMASFVVVSALPALAAAESVTVTCRRVPFGEVIFEFDRVGVPRNSLGIDRKRCKELGGKLTLQVNHEPGPPSERPPCCVP